MSLKVLEEILKKHISETIQEFSSPSWVRIYGSLNLGPIQQISETFLILQSELVFVLFYFVSVLFY